MSDGFNAFLVLLGIAMAGVLVSIVVVARRNAEDVHVRAARIHNALGRLSRKPGDRAALDTIASALGDRKWLLRPAVKRESELWDRALGFGFDNIGVPDGREVLRRLVVPLAPSLIFDPDALLRRAVAAIREAPSRRDVHTAMLETLNGVPRDRIAVNQSAWLYQQVLDLVQQHPGQPEVSVLALDLGRWHCGRTRPDGKVTVYDEQMLRNDIAVRRSSS